jgi:hypothetical protein
MQEDKNIKSFYDIADEILPQIKTEYIEAIKND